MRGEQLARQWRILRIIESEKHGATVAELAQQGDCHTGSGWLDLASIREAGFRFYPQKECQKSRLTSLDLEQGRMLSVRGRSARQFLHERALGLFLLGFAEGKVYDR